MAFERNPVLMRELRTRWRGRRGFLFLFGALTALCIAAVLWYADSLYYMPDVINDEASAHFSRLGRDVFLQLSFGQLFFWMAIAATLASGAIARERELGLLESVQLAALHPVRLVTGKFWAIVGYILLLQITLLPLETVVFSMGGVAPGEFVQCWVVQVAAFITAAAIGIMFSAWSRRTPPALVCSVTLIIILLAAGDLSCGVCGFRNSVIMENLWPSADVPRPIRHFVLYGSPAVRRVLFVGVQADPFNAMSIIAQPDWLCAIESFYENGEASYADEDVGPPPVKLAPPPAIPPPTWGAKMAPPAPPGDKMGSPPAVAPPPPPAPLSSPPPGWPSPPVERPGPPLPIPLAPPSPSAPAYTSTTIILAPPAPQPVVPSWLVALVGAATVTCTCLSLAWRGSAKVWNEAQPLRERRRFLLLRRANGQARLGLGAVTPECSGATPTTWNRTLLSWIRCPNPIAQRELRLYLQLPRLRGGAAPALGVMLRVLLAAMYIAWVYGVWAMPEESASLLVMFAMAPLVLVAAVQGARTFALEKERATWTGVMLTPLSGLQIVAGKFLPIAGAGCLYAAALALPILLRDRPALRWNTIATSDNLGWAILVALGALLSTAAVAVCMSWFCRRTTVAVVWTVIGWLLLQACLTPLGAQPFEALAAMDYLDTTEMTDNHGVPLYPVRLGMSSEWNVTGIALHSSLTTLGWAVVLLALLWLEIHRHLGREHDRRFRRTALPLPGG